MLFEMPQELIDEIQKACELTSAVVESKERIDELVDQLDLLDYQTIIIKSAISEYIDYGYFANVSLKELFHHHARKW